MVVLPQPVGPVTNTIPWVLRRLCSHPCRHTAFMPRSSRSIRAAVLSMILNTMDSPNTVGTVETRRSTLPWVPENSI